MGETVDEQGSESEYTDFLGRVDAREDLVEVAARTVDVGLLVLKRVEVFGVPEPMRSTRA